MLKREWGAESNGKLSHLSIPSKTAARVPEFAVKDLPLDRILMMMIMYVSSSSPPVARQLCVGLLAFLRSPPFVFVQCYAPPIPNSQCPHVLSDTVKVTIRPHFPGHVLIFKSYITVRAEFSKSTQMSGNWT